jgi:hypothetical protein
VAQAFQPVPKKQVSRAQPGKAVPPVNTSFSWVIGEPTAHKRLTLIFIAKLISLGNYFSFDAQNYPS